MSVGTTDVSFGCGEDHDFTTWPTGDGDTADVTVRWPGSHDWELTAVTVSPSNVWTCRRCSAVVERTVSEKPDTDGWCGQLSTCVACAEFVTYVFRVHGGHPLTAFSGFVSCGAPAYTRNQFKSLLHDFFSPPREQAETFVETGEDE